MIIGVKYWNHGASAPATWTDVHVAECEADFDHFIYDEVNAFDGTNESWARNYYFTRLVIDPFSFNHATYGGVVTALRKADYCRVKDTRYSWLGDTNTIDFLVPANRGERSEPSLFTRSVTMELKARVTHT